MENSFSWEANSRLTSQESPLHLRSAEVSLLCSQMRTSGPYTEPHESSPRTPTIFRQDQS